MSLKGVTAMIDAVMDNFVMPVMDFFMMVISILLVVFGIPLMILCFIEIIKHPEKMCIHVKNVDDEDE